MKLRFIFLIVSAIIIIDNPTTAQSAREWSSFKRSFTFGLNNSALMTKYNGQIYDFPFSNSPSLRQGIHLGYQITTKRYGLFELETGIELCHHVLRPIKNEGRDFDISRFRLLNENNVFSTDLQTKVFISPLDVNSRFRIFVGYRASLPFAEFFWTNRHYQQDRIFVRLLKYQTGFESVRFINHFLMLGTDYRLSDHWRLEANFNTMLGIWLKDDFVGLPNTTTEQYILNFQLSAKYYFKKRHNFTEEHKQNK